MAPHGNSRSDTTSYYRTQPTTLEALKVAVDKQGAKKACNTVFQEAGGSLHSRSMSEDPRNQQQARSLKHRYSAQKDDDELYSLIMQRKEHASRDDKGYIHGLKIENAPQCVLANKRQLEDLVRSIPTQSSFQWLVWIQHSVWDVSSSHRWSIRTWHWPNVEMESIRTSLARPLFTRPVWQKITVISSASWRSSTQPWSLSRQRELMTNWRHQAWCVLNFPMPWG